MPWDLTAVPVAVGAVIVSLWFLSLLIRATRKMQKDQGSELERQAQVIVQLSEWVTAARLETWACEQRFARLVKWLRQDMKLDVPGDIWNDPVPTD